jgi:hypothetical protein
MGKVSGPELTGLQNHVRATTWHAQGAVFGVAQPQLIPIFGARNIERKELLTV